MLLISFAYPNKQKWSENLNENLHFYLRNGILRQNNNITNVVIKHGFVIHDKNLIIYEKKNKPSRFEKSPIVKIFVASLYQIPNFTYNHTFSGHYETYFFIHKSSINTITFFEVSMLLIPSTLPPLLRNTSTTIIY